jgi:hypothetical protein
MSKRTTTDTSTTAPADTSTPTDAFSQPSQPEPTSDSFGSMATGDDMVKDPVIINRDA